MPIDVVREEEQEVYSYKCVSAHDLYPYHVYDLTDVLVYDLS